MLEAMLKSWSFPREKRDADATRKISEKGHVAFRCGWQTRYAAGQPAR